MASGKTEHLSLIGRRGAAFLRSNQGLFEAKLWSYLKISELNRILYLHSHEQNPAGFTESDFFIEIIMVQWVQRGRIPGVKSQVCLMCFTQYQAQCLMDVIEWLRARHSPDRITISLTGLWLFQSPFQGSSLPAPQASGTSFLFSYFPVPWPPLSAFPSLAV